MNDKIDSVMDLIVEFGDDMHSFGERMDSAEEASRHFDNAKEGLIEIRAALEQLAPQGDGVPVAWGVPNSAITGSGHALMQVMLEIPPSAQYPELLVPLYATPPATVLKDEYEALKAAFLKYARHGHDDKMCEMMKHPEFPCTCGLDSFIAALSTNPADEVK